MKPLESTTFLLNYQWWCELASSIVGAAARYEMHKRPEQLQRAADQALDAAFNAERWHDRWLNTEDETRRA
jgi:hypothetical protein